MGRRGDPLDQRGVGEAAHLLHHLVGDLIAGLLLASERDVLEADERRGLERGHQREHDRDGDHGLEQAEATLVTMQTSQEPRAQGGPGHCSASAISSL